MKKLFYLLSVLLMLAPTAFAEELPCEAFVEVPSVIYPPSAVSLFSDRPSAEEKLYNLIEKNILENSRDGAMRNNIVFSVLDYAIQSSDANAAKNPNAKMTASAFMDLYSSVVYAHPEIGNLITGFSYDFVKDENDPRNGYITRIQPMYREVFSQEKYDALETDEEKAAYLASTHDEDAFNQAIDYAYSKAIAPDMTNDLQKLLAIHDYLADSVTYSPIIASDTISDEDKEKYTTYNNHLVYTTYSALVGERISVCSGYSLAFKLLCDMADIDCGYATSDSINHIWNVAAYDGKYYHIDVTWDDPVIDDDGSTQIVRSANFMISEWKKVATIKTMYSGYTNDIVTAYESDSTLSVPFADRIDPFYWQDGKFYYKRTGFLIDSRLFTPPVSPSYYKIDGNIATYSEITSDKYLPDIKMDSQIHNVFADNSVNKVALDGAADTNADFYAVSYDGNGNLTSAKKVDVSFNSYGEAVAEFTGGFSKLLLFGNNGINPLSFAK